MQPFHYSREDNAQSAVGAQVWRGAERDAHINAATQYLAGGTTLIDLMRLNVMQPRNVIDINALSGGNLGKIEFGQQGLKLGALAHMAEAADHKDIRDNYPVIAQALYFAASPQIRNMATLGGNVMQRTRCSYFRDVSYENCNKRNPGSGCAAMDGVNRMHAVLGTSDQCIATYPGDFAQALIALDATVEVTGRSGTRSLPFAELHKAPGNTPDIETTLKPGEL